MQNQWQDRTKHEFDAPEIRPQGFHPRFQPVPRACNNTLDRTLYGGRITARSATRQRSVTIGFVLCRNVIANHIHQRRQQSPAA
ncbi:hypothetical protein BKG60_16805 [Mycobacterium syngnathidarum]|uniref:Uncharacterized protein n=1 Tax=Mycobacterium syngnathidarum TaxID=1908205 RepID=A0A1Q9W9L8_9MYCO|nr:hypothetical protein BKG61_11145 [Mycobacterium syngnathidarum]OLT95488.1 hypothetical protein BKG60_16805 [Mycobacterium syngnathidarum]